MSAEQYADQVVVDSKRPVWALLGLPFDAIGMDEAVKSVIHSVENKTPLFISTPNLNFVVAALGDASFRESVINSDLSVADGMPLIWISRILGIPILERVAGSDLVESLIHSPELISRPIKVFFFGGDEGVAKIACQKLETLGAGLVGVGSYYPGFGTVEEMSHATIIDQVNQSGADFVIVALGAKKGQRWIEQNRSKLNAPVISHLGAVVNFVAGTTKRAPVVFQKTGLEWVWRIWEEPSLWKRYFGDGVTFLRLLITRVIPNILSNLKYSNPAIANAGITLVDEKNGDDVLFQLSGVADSNTLGIFQDRLFDLDNSVVRVRLDLKELKYADASFVGLLFSLRKVFGENLVIENVPANIKKTIYYNCADGLLSS